MAHRDHPWFLKNLPPYLAMSAEQHIQRTEQIDEEIVGLITKVGIKQHNTTQTQHKHNTNKHKHKF